jgi:hypothetical protein
MLQPVECTEEEAAALQDAEMSTMAYLSQNGNTSVTAQTFGILPLSTGSPEMFNRLVDVYSQMLDMTLDENMYRVDHGRADRLKQVAAQLGFLRAGPKDVIEIHRSALKYKIRQVYFRKAQAYISEGRILVLELMGYLANYYRSRAFRFLSGAADGETPVDPDPYAPGTPSNTNQGAVGGPGG